MNYLIDTNVISELTKALPNRGVLTWFDEVTHSQLYLSVLVIGEITKGIERLRSRDAERASDFEDWVEELKHAYGNRILPVTTEIAVEWGRIRAVRSVPVVDGLLAATAKVHDMTFATRNGNDIKGTGARVVDPFALRTG